MELLLMRHADKKEDSKILDKDKLSLSEIGREKTKKIAFVIKNKLDKERIDLILYSPAIHATETAKLISHILVYPKEVIEEVSFS